MALPNHKELESSNLGYGGSVIGEVTRFPGKTKGYDIEAYLSNGIPFTRLPYCETLIHRAKALYLAVYPNRHKETSERRVALGLSHQRTILQFARYNGEDVGLGIFPRFYVDGKPSVYSSRAVLLEHEGEGVGTHMLDKAVYLHQVAIGRDRFIAFVVFMSQNPASFASARKLACFEKDFPFGEGFEQDRDAQNAMLEGHRLFRFKSQSIDTDTGVSRGELRELGPNESFKPREGTSSFVIFKRMVSQPPYGFGVNREGGDVVWAAIKLRKPKTL